VCVEYIVRESAPLAARPEALFSQRAPSTAAAPPSPPTAGKPDMAVAGAPELATADAETAAAAAALPEMNHADSAPERRRHLWLLTARYLDKDKGTLGPWFVKWMGA